MDSTPYGSIIFVVLFVVLSSSLLAQSPIIVSKTTKELRVPFEQMLTFEDTTTRLSFSDIRNTDYASKFNLQGHRVERFSSAYWAKFTFAGEALKEKSWFLEGRDPNTHFMDFYIPNSDGSYSEHKMGLLRPFDDRLIPYKNFVLELPNHSDSLTIFVRIASGNPAQFLFRLKSSGFLLSYAINEYVLLGIFYGIILVMAVYNLLLFLFMKEKLYFWYVLYVLAAGLTCSIEDGLGFQYLWPALYGLNHYIEYLVGVLFLISFLFYANALIEISIRRPMMFKVLVGITAGAILYLLMHKLFGLETSLISIYTLPLAFAFVVALSLLRERFAPAKYFVLACSLIMVSLLILFLNKINAFSWNYMSNVVIIVLVYAFNIALVVEVIILSLAQAQKLRYFQAEQEKTLKDSESRFRGIFQASSDAILVYDFKKHRILNNNDRAAQIFGYGEEEWRELQIGQLIKLPSSANGNISADLMSGNLPEAAFYNMGIGFKKSGEPFDCELTVARLKEVEQEYSVIAIKDISRRKTAEHNLQHRMEEIRKKNEELEKYIASNLELENFAYVASHDIKQPLRTITSFSQLLQRRLGKAKDVPESVYEYLDFIIAAAKNLNDLIHGLLDHAKVGQVGEYKFQMTDMNRMVKGVELGLNEQLQESGAELHYQDLPEIFAEPNRISQLLQNLISNAVKFRRDDQPCRITIEAKSDDQFWQFSVKDNGIGIPAEKQEAVFNMFTKLHAKEEFSGHGIGLATCKKIVEIHGGEIWLESEVDKGTTFYFTINKELKGVEL